MTTRYLGKVNVDNTKYNFELHPSLYGNICSSLLTDGDKQNLIDRKCYMRIFGKQDSPNSEAYIECYIREIDRMQIESHVEEKDDLFERYYGKNFVLMEINYVTRGFFFMLDIRNGTICI